MATVTIGGVTYTATRRSDGTYQAGAPVSSAKTTTTSSSGGGGSSSGTSTAPSSPATVSYGGVTYQVEQRGGQYYATSGGRFYGSGSSALEAAKAAQQEEADIARATAGAQKESAKAIAAGGSTSSYPYYVDASGTRYNEYQMETKLTDVEAAALRYAAATGQPKPDFSGRTQARGSTPAAPDLFLSPQLGSMVERAPRTPEGLGYVSGEMKRASDYAVWTGMMEEREYAKQAGLVERSRAAVGPLEEKWAGKTITSAEGAYEYVTERQAVDKELAGISSAFSVSEAKAAGLKARREVVGSSYEAAYAMIGYDTPGRGMITEVAQAEARKTEAAVAYELKKVTGYTPTVESAGEKSARWGAFGAGISLYSGVLGLSAANPFTVGVGGLGGVAAGLAYEGSKYVYGRAVEPVVSAWAGEGSLRAGVAPDLGTMAGAFLEFEAGVFVPSFNIEDKRAPLKRLEEKAKAGPTMAEFIESKMRGQETYAGYEIYRPDVAAGMAVEAASIGTAVVAPGVLTWAGSKVMASKPYQAFQQFVGRREVLDVKVGGGVTDMLQVTKPATGPSETARLTSPMGGVDVTTSSGARTGGTLTVETTQAYGSKPGTAVYKIEQFLESSYLGGPKADPYKVWTSIQVIPIGSESVGSMYTTGGPLQLAPGSMRVGGEPSKAGDIQVGGDIAKMRYSSTKTPEGMPWSPIDETGHTRTAYTYWERTGWDSETSNGLRTWTASIGKEGRIPELQYSVYSGELEKTSIGARQAYSYEFTGTSVRAGGESYPISGKVWLVEYVPPQQINLIPSSGGPKTPWSYGYGAPKEAGSKIVELAGGGTEEVSGNIFSGFTQAPGAIEYAAGRGAAVALEETTYLAVPPGFVFPPGIPDVGVRIDVLETGVGLGSYSPPSRPSEPPRAGRRPGGKQELKPLYRSIVEPTLGVSWEYEEANAIDVVTARAQPYVSPGVGGTQWTGPKPIEEFEQRPIVVTTPKTSFQELTMQEQQTFQPPGMSFISFSFPEFPRPTAPEPVPAVVPMVGVMDFGGYGGGRRGLSPFFFEPRKGKKSRLRPTYTLLDVFEIEASTGREARHPVGPKAERAFGLSLAVGSDFTRADFPGVYGKKGKKKKSRDLWGLF